jgi:hypothetical protein
MGIHFWAIEVRGKISRANLDQAEDNETNGQDKEQLDETVPDGQTNGLGTKDDKRTPKKLIEDETRETGSVKRSVYVTYLKATGRHSVLGFGSHLLYNCTMSNLGSLLVDQDMDIQPARG